MDKNKQKSEKKQKNIKSQNKIIGLDIDKAEYQEIVLSNSNYPEKSFYKF